MSSSKVTGIYRLTAPNGKVYIGQSHDVSTRLRQHGKGVGGKLYNSIRKYGWGNFQKDLILELPDADQEVLNACELFWIKVYDAAGKDNLNSMAGGYGGLRTPETRALMSKSRTGRVPSEETRALMSKSQTGRVQSAEARAKVSAARKLAPSRKGIPQGRKGIPQGPRSAEQKARIREGILRARQAREALQ